MNLFRLNMEYSTNGLARSIYSGMLLSRLLDIAEAELGLSLSVGHKHGVLMDLALYGKAEWNDGKNKLIFYV